MLQPSTSESSLRQSLALRLYWAGAVTLLVGTATTLVLYFAVDSAARTSQISELEGYFQSRIAREDDDLRIQGDVFRAQIEFNQLFNAADPRRSKLTSYLTNFGGQQQFTHVVIEDAAAHEIFRYASGTADARLAATGAPVEGLAWAYSAADHIYYRVIATKLWLGPMGNGRLLLFFPLNGAVINALSAPGIAIGITSPAADTGKAPDAGPLLSGADAIRIDIPWDTKASGPRLTVRKQFTSPLPLMLTSAIVGLTLGLLLLLTRFGLAQWLLNVSKRLQELGEAATQFGASHQVTAALSGKLQAAHADANDEVSQLAYEVGQMIKATETAEAGLLALNKNLELRVEERTADLQKALDELRKLHDHLMQTEKLASLGSMVAGISHELNTPIGNALMVATALVTTVDDFELNTRDGIKRSQLAAFVQSSREAADLIERSARKASELVASFKQVAVDQTSLQRREFDLATLVVDTIRTTWTPFKKEPWHMEVEIPQGIVCDSYPGPLGQVVTNLIQNAAVHAFAGRREGKISVHAAVDAQQQVRLSVTDDGVGMDSSVRSRVFEPFFTTRLGKGGSGLGLSICYRITTTTLGGAIHVESTPGAGSSFTLEFPLRAPGKL